MGYSIKAWWLAIGLPVAGFLFASIVGAVVAGGLVIACVRCRKRWLEGARGYDLLVSHQQHGGRHER